jgi:peptide/nickel transport system permease protein
MKSQRSFWIFRSGVWPQFKKNKPALISFYVIVFTAVIALLAPLLATHRPLYVKMFGQSFFPAFSLNQTLTVNTNIGAERIIIDAIDWRLMPNEKIIWAPIPYSPNEGDYITGKFISPSGDQKFMEKAKVIDMPLRFRHWLGTGSRGNDLLSGLIHGARISLTIGLIAMSIAGTIGILIGLLAGFFGDDKLVITLGKLFMILLGIFFGWFYAFQLRSNQLQSGLQEQSGGLLIQLLISLFLFALIVFVFSLAGKWIGKIPWLNKRIVIPVDSLLSRLIEIFVSLPILLLIIVIAAISTPSLVNVMIIIGLTNWTSIARLTRAEMLRVRQLEYIQSAQALGFNSLRIILRHALPNAVAPALIAISIGVANAILIESSLSYIGIGVPTNIETWGSLISSGRDNFSAWWMVVFPGFCILITVLSLNLIGEGLRDAMDPKLRK